MQIDRSLFSVPTWVSFVSVIASVWSASSVVAIAIHVTPCFLIVASHFHPFCFFTPLCISIHFHLLPPQIIWREGADRVWGVAEESFWVHKWFNEDRLHHNSSAQGNHICYQQVFQSTFSSSFIFILVLLYPVIFSPLFWFTIHNSVLMFLSSLTMCTVYQVDLWKVKVVLAL